MRRYIQYEDQIISLDNLVSIDLSWGDKYLEMESCITFYYTNYRNTNENDLNQGATIKLYVPHEKEQEIFEKIKSLIDAEIYQLR